MMNSSDCIKFLPNSDAEYSEILDFILERTNTPHHVENILVPSSVYSLIGVWFRGAEIKIDWWVPCGEEVYTSKELFKLAFLKKAKMRVIS